MPRIPAALAAADGMPTDSSSIDSFEDDLAMAIALKDWDQSVELVLKGKSIQPAITLAYLDQPEDTSQAPLRSLSRILASPHVSPPSPANWSTRSLTISRTQTYVARKLSALVHIWHAWMSRKLQVMRSCALEKSYWASARE